MRSTKFRILSQIKGNSINLRVFILKFIIFVRGTHSVYAPPGVKEPSDATASKQHHSSRYGSNFARVNSTCPYQYSLKLNMIFYNFTISLKPFDAGIKYMVSSGRSVDVLITICHPINVRCTCEIKSRIAMVNAAFNKKRFFLLAHWI